MQIELTRQPSDMMRETLLVAAMSAYENFLNAVISGLLRSNENLLRGSGMTFTAEQVLEAKNRRALIRVMQTRTYERQTRTFDTRNKFLTSTLGEEVALTPVWPYIAMRNALVHNSGVLTDEHLRNYTGQDLSSGQRVLVIPHTLKSCVDLIGTYSNDLITEARAKD